MKLGKLAEYFAPVFFGIALGLVICLASVGVFTLAALEAIYSSGNRIVIEAKP